MQTTNTHFSEEQINLVYPAGIENYYWHQARNYIVRRWTQHLGFPEAACLDIGCGSGTTVAFFLARNTLCYGCDLSSYKPYKGIEKHLFLGKQLSEIPEDIRSSVKIALLLDVIEHLPDPKNLITEIRQNLPNIQFLLITVPARRELWTEFDDYYGHYRRYTLPDFKEFADANKLTLVRCRYLFQMQYPVALFLYRFVKRKRSFTIKAPKQYWLHKIVAFLFRAESRFSPRWIAGTSVIGLLKI